MPLPFIGRFANVVGLSYRSGNLEGVTDAEGRFYYEAAPSSRVSFSIGSLEIGSTVGHAVVSLIDLGDDNTTFEDPKLLNRGRLLFSLTTALGFESPIVIDEDVRAIVEKYKSELDLDAENPSSLDSVFLKIGQELNRPMKTIPHVRNHLRRAASGFKVLRDIKVPVRDGQYVLADVYLPLDDQQRYPVLVSNTIYGKRVVFSGPDTSDEHDVAAFEKAEDDWFSTTADVPLHVPNTKSWFHTWTNQRVFETIGTFNTFVWVPKGYAMVKVDPRGVSQTPGIRGIPGQETNDLFDAVEWSASQSWSSGNVALVGNSYGANCQWAVAALRPKGLKAMIPYAADVDRYRDVVYMGGIPVFNYLSQWADGVRAASPKWKDTGDMIPMLRSRPFYDQAWESTTPNLERISVPCFLAASQMLVVHNRGSFEAWRRLQSADKHLQIVDSHYYGWPNREVAHLLIAFLDRHLKGLEPPKVERVGIQMRTGGGEWFWRVEEDWPVPGTRYARWFLHPDGKFSPELPNKITKTFSYSAEPGSPGSAAGATFISEPLAADIEIAGHCTGTVHISSTSPDADVVLSVWAVDNAGSPVRFGVQSELQPLESGLLRASHRKIDPAKSLPWRPWHTHTKEDYAPLQPDEVVKLQIEIPPATAVLRRGWRLRVDVTPSEDQPNIPGFQSSKLRNFGGDFCQGSENRLHVGPDHINFLVIPVVPATEMRQHI